MKTANSALQAYLPIAKTLYIAEVYTINLISGNTFYYTSLDVNIIYNGITFYANELLLERGATTQTKGIELSEMDIKAIPKSMVQLNGVDFIKACRMGMLDGARIKLERIFYSQWWEPNEDQTQYQIDGITWFSGRVSDIEPSRTQVLIKVKSDTELFNVNWPKNYYKTECQWQLYDDNCQLDSDDFKETGLIDNDSGTSTQAELYTDMTGFGDGYFDLGYIVFTSGDNAGEYRTIKSYVSDTGQFSIIPPLPYVPIFLDEFDAFPGCDRTKTMCESIKFNNSEHYRGFNYVPTPETAT